MWRYFVADGLIHSFLSKAMSLSKPVPVSDSDFIDLKVHYEYYGQSRCSLVDVGYSALYAMEYSDLVDFLKCEIPQVNKLTVVRLAFMDDEGTFIDLTARNFHRFLRLSTQCFQNQTPRITIKVIEGSSPAPQRQTANADTSSSFKSSTATAGTNAEARKQLVFDKETYKQEYKSPVEIESMLKKRELERKEVEFGEITQVYEEKWQEFNPVPAAPIDTSKSLCTRCHLRMGHTKNRSVHSLNFLLRVFILQW